MKIPTTKENKSKLVSKLYRGNEPTQLITTKYDDDH